MIEPLIIEETPDTPRVELNKETGTFIIAGNSYPEYPFEFFVPMFKWIENYMADPNPETKFEFKYEYLNSSSVKQTARLLAQLENVAKVSNTIICWYYDENNPDVGKLGNLFSKKTTLGFSVIKTD